ncbi:glycosyltransferase family 1 protein [Corticibacter populi]|uniref:Glycosyltransferase family 1 protein n=1 Tax=Corticibacter populi TaxID=1550736 RepID=A0A3M6QKA9_9BURK|nr:glycosyltransferase family 1 protein [Corticibacter populi]RMX03530.1 glycosyltransferase family 1 protein [Corticibacter populi]RZS29980.1 glycosyltransferase involved in cell wall biosynthesis [Corticibacter populi]
MRVGIDYRAATVAPYSGIGRQVRALEQALTELVGPSQLLRLSELPLDDPRRAGMLCPPWASPMAGLQRPQVRWRFERRFLPAALAAQHVGLYIATVNMGLPIGPRAAGLRYALVLHDLFQLTERNHHRSLLKALAYRAIDRASIQWSVHQADRIWCPSRFTMEEAVRLFPQAEGKLRLLPNLVDPMQAQKGTAVVMPALPARYWLLIGTQEPRKNIPFFIRAWQALRQQGQELPDLVLVGAPGPLPTAMQQGEGLHWMQGLDDAQLHQLYARAECLWQPSYAEGFGLPVVEALGIGTPVAVAHGSALDEVAPPAAPRFSPYDTEQLRQCMRALARQPLKREAELQDWAARYAWPAYRARLAALLQELEPA